MLDRQSMRLVEGREQSKSRHAVAAFLLFAALRAVEHHHAIGAEAEALTVLRSYCSFSTRGPLGESTFAVENVDGELGV